MPGPRQTSKVCPGMSRGVLGNFVYKTNVFVNDVSFLKQSRGETHAFGVSRGVPGNFAYEANVFH